MVLVVNKKARYEYFLNRSENAGIILSGPEVKSIRKGDCSLKEAYCTIDDNEVFIRNMHISGSTDPTRTRKLLLKRKEISKLKKDMTKGMTLIPYQLFQNDRGLMKIEIFLAKGKKLYDKREVIKKRDLEKDNDE